MKVSALIDCLQRYVHVFGDDTVEFVLDDEGEAVFSKIHDGYYESTGGTERCCEIRLKELGGDPT